MLLLELLELLELLRLLELLELLRLLELLEAFRLLELPDCREGWAWLDDLGCGSLLAIVLRELDCGLLEDATREDCRTTGLGSEVRVVRVICSVRMVRRASLLRARRFARSERESVGSGEVERRLRTSSCCRVPLPVATGPDCTDSRLERVNRTCLSAGMGLLSGCLLTRCSIRLYPSGKGRGWISDEPWRA